MKALRVEDHGLQAGIMRYKVVKMVDIVEWEMGEYLPKSDLENILRRSGHNSIKVEIVPKKG